MSGRAASNRYSRFEVAALLLVSILAGRPPARAAAETQNYSVPARTAWSVARETGFAFDAGTCQLGNDVERQNIEVSTTRRQGCRATLFAGPLAEGWQLLDVQHSCSHPGLCEVSVSRNGRTGVTVRIASDGGRDTSVRTAFLNTLTLTGPAGSDWRQAFRARQR